jgi:dCMP deaminase
MTRPNWDEVWMQFADTIALRSKCSRAQVGCVIVDKDQNVLSASYNGPPSKYIADGPCTNWCPRGRGEGGLGSTYDNCPSVHSEVNAIARVDRSRTVGATAYVTRACCIGCAKALAAAGIVRVIHRVDTIDLHRNPDETEKFLKECDINVERWTNN